MQGPAGITDMVAQHPGLTAQVAQHPGLTDQVAQHPGPAVISEQTKATRKTMSYITFFILKQL